MPVLFIALFNKKLLLLKIKSNLLLFEHQPETLCLLLNNGYFSLS